jgi:membrane protease YdiL (CAAX protease family)
MPVPFVLLVLSICAAWLPPLPIGQKRRLPLWALIYAVAVLTAFAQGFLQASGVVALIALVGLALMVARTTSKGWYWLAFTLLLVLSLALALHKVPGFSNPIVINAVQFTPDAKPFTQYLNFDKGSVGLVLVALLSPKLRRGDRAGRLAGETVVGFALTTAVVLGIAAASGLVRLDPKLPAEALFFLTTNLFLTCVAEEAFFRSLVQDPLRGARPGKDVGAGGLWSVRIVLAIVVSGVLFGFAHAAGGPSMILMATLAGLGYAAVYARTNRIEPPILVHFGLNATHFLAFTYPALRG